MSLLRRVSAGVIGAVALAAFMTRVYLTMEADDHGLMAALWKVLRYFTLWSNLFVGLLGLWVAVTGKVAPRLSGGLLLAITLVGAVYYVLLASKMHHEGLDKLVDVAFHAIVPIAFTLHWLLLEPKGALRWRDLLPWLAYPLVYCVYAMVRGAFDGKYPYFFLDPTDIGVAGVAAYVAGLVVAFALVGAAIMAYARRRA